MSLFYNKIDVFKDAEKCCESLEEGEECSFYLDDKSIEGFCERGKKDVLICKPLEPSPNLERFFRK